MGYSIPGEFADVDALKAAVVDDGLSIVTSHVSRASETTVCCSSDCSTVGVLVGDAVFPAHYRLGIGVNNAIDALHNFGVFISKLTQAPVTSLWADLVAEKKMVDEQRMAAVWTLQVKIMWLECYCNVHVFQTAVRVPLEDSEELLGKLAYRPVYNVSDLYNVQVYRKHPMIALPANAPLGRKRVSRGLYRAVSLDTAVHTCEQYLGEEHWWFPGDAGEEAARLVLTQATFHDPQSVVNVIDAFGYTNWMMNVGDRKGELLSAEIQKLPPGACVLELGAYIGYSAVRIGKDLKAGAHLLSLEKDERRAKLARQTVAHAGLSDRVTILHGVLQGEEDSGVIDEQTLERFACRGTFSLIFFDHTKPAYFPDLIYLERKGFIRAGTVIVGDNVLWPGAPEFRKYVKEASHYRTVEHETLVEYQTEKQDIVLVAVATSNPPAQ